MNKPLWAIIWLIAFEAIILAVLIPGDWTARVIQKEAILLEERLGKEEQQWVHSRARRWFNDSLINNGLYKAAHNHLIPTQNQRDKSTGLENMGKGWFGWVEGRLQAFSNMYYHILARFALLLTWAPYFLILFVPAAFDGITTWKIKRTNFAYSSPSVHQYSTRSIGYILAILIGLFIAPLVLEPMLIPSAIMVICVMSGLMFGNIQKRI